LIKFRAYLTIKMLNKKTENWGGVRHLSIDEMSQCQGHKDFVTV
jgi:hypothetical protein